MLARTTPLPPAFLPPPAVVVRCPVSAPAPDFARLLGAAAWSRLAPAVRRRFAATPAVDRPIHYHGLMHEVRSSPAGWALARLCRIVGAPFALHDGTDVPVTITLRSRDAGAAIAWERTYRYADHAATVVRSEKRLGADGALIEQVGGGFAMRLDLREADGALHFHSRGYCWRIGRWVVPVPGWLSPGVAHVIHQDLGGGRFRFAMTIRHALFGTLFSQDGVFHEEGTTP